MQARRRFHRDQADELQQVVLDHVAQRADLVEVLHAPADAEVFRNRDLHVIDRAAPPQRFEQRIGEAQREQVLHRLLAEVMVDAVDLVLGETVAHFIIDRAGRLVVVPERLLEHDAAVGGDQAVLLQSLRDGAEQARRRREVGDADAVFAARKQVDERAPVVVVVRIALHVVDAVAQLRPLRVIEIAAAEIVLQRLLDETEVLVAAQVTTAGRDDAAVARDLAVAFAVVQRRQQLAHGQVTGTAEYDEVEDIDRYEICHREILCEAEILLRNSPLLTIFLDSTRVFL